MSNIFPLVVTVDVDEVTVNTRKGVEVCHWIKDEWLEDPSIVPAIANAVHMAYSDPTRLLNINMDHILPQLEF